MDTLDVKSFRPKPGPRPLAFDMPIVRWPQDPRDAVAVDRRLAAFAEEHLETPPDLPQEHVPELAVEAAVVPAPVPTEEPEPTSDEERIQLLLEDLPADIKAAARQILKGQMKTRHEPGKGLKGQQKAERFAAITEPELQMTVLDTIMEDARPILDNDLSGS